MALPTILPYAMPGPHELPVNRVGWSLVPERCALLVHDMQAYFLDAFRQGASPVNELSASVASLQRVAAARAVPVFFSVQPGAQSPARRGLLQDFWGPGIGAAEEATRIATKRPPGHGDTVIVKHRYSALHGTSLLEELRRRGRDQLVICGVYAHIGCLATALDAFMHDVRPFLVGDAVADFSAKDHAMALEYASQRCAVVTSTRAVVTALGRDRALSAPASERSA